MSTYRDLDRKQLQELCTKNGLSGYCDKNMSIMRRALREYNKIRKPIKEPYDSPLKFRKGHVEKGIDGKYYKIVVLKNELKRWKLCNKSSVICRNKHQEQEQLFGTNVVYKPPPPICMKFLGMSRQLLKEKNSGNVPYSIQVSRHDLWNKMSKYEKYYCIRTLEMYGVNAPIESDAEMARLKSSNIANFNKAYNQTKALMKERMEAEQKRRNNAIIEQNRLLKEIELERKKKREIKQEKPKGTVEKPKQEGIITRLVEPLSPYIITNLENIKKVYNLMPISSSNIVSCLDKNWFADIELVIRVGTFSKFIKGKDPTRFTLQKRLSVSEKDKEYDTKLYTSFIHNGKPKWLVERKTSGCYENGGFYLVLDKVDGTFYDLLNEAMSINEVNTYLEMVIIFWQTFQDTFVHGLFIPEHILYKKNGSNIQFYLSNLESSIIKKDFNSKFYESLFLLDKDQMSRINNILKDELYDLKTFKNILIKNNIFVNEVNQVFKKYGI